MLAYLSLLNAVYQKLIFLLGFIYTLIRIL
jgi:hypothetical protein